MQIDEEDDSPIEEVRVTISNTDDPTLPYNTFRMWFLGLGWTCIISFINQFFYLRYTAVTVGYSVVALLSLPMGRFMARVLPTRYFNIFGFKFTLNPGPFSIKEHVLIGTMVACNGGTAYAVDIVVLQKVWYNSEKPFVAGMLLVLTTQVTGFAIAGALRRFLVRPAHMIWPQTLVSASLFRSLHASSVDDGHMSRMKYFLLVSMGMFFYYWLPGYIFPTLGVLSVLCWINPDNVVLAQLTGSYGLGIGTISLDWGAISAYVSPMATPWFAQVNILIGFIIVTYVICPWAYYTDLWKSKNFPIVIAQLYQDNGSSYNISAVMDQRGFLDENKYKEYGPLRMDSFFAISYGIGFAGLTATIVHVILYNGREIMERWRYSRLDSEDIHARLMSVYPEVPDWWYGLLFGVMFVLSMITCVVWDYMPWWALLLALVMALIFVLPVGIVAAITNQQPSLNIITEYVIGFLLPGHAIANVTFKTYGFIVNVQALSFVGDLKLGHYMKIPPRAMFMAQLVSAMISCIINLATATWLINTRENICTDEGYPFTCRTSRTFYAASIIWGAIGPARVFGDVDGAIYAPVQWGFVVGAALPLIFWFLSQKFPNVSWLKYVHWPVLLASTSNMPPGLPYMYSNGLFWGFIFSFVLRRYQYGWWARYNYLTAAALDTGMAISALLIFFALQMWEINMPFWWGNPNWRDPDPNAAVLDHCYHSGSNFYGEQL
ncbi:oligopeptide transporter OPT family [Lobosporangium transversale]|uniref:Oligopeptide transporter OPT family n=1 Tax=Lobosporangium transversale TaxID=64571 RepID=A0A1Y2GE36_9FUNG|nr:oligopeptide transporter OPT family [Lobosporangium transversale]ORZ06529.1 oligopeptide transporter OPT family [Lobosporangium transversale]|eukprot:XP_021877572.1 oligopeptide transporter OPT family [Lobosporangium transversale]